MCRWMILLVLGSGFQLANAQTSSVLANIKLSRCVQDTYKTMSAISAAGLLPCRQEEPSVEAASLPSSWNDRLFERGPSNIVGAANGPREVTGRYDINMRRCGDLPATQECPFEVRARFSAVCPDDQTGLAVTYSTGARGCARAQDIRVRTALIQVFDISGIPRLATQTNDETLDPVGYAAIRASNGSAAEVCASMSDGPTPEEQYDNPAFNPVHTWVVVSVSPGGQPVCGPNPSAKIVADLQQATCQGEKDRVLREGGAVNPNLCTKEEDQLIVVKLVNRQHTAQECRSLGTTTFLVDPSTATAASYLVGMSGGTTKICSYAVQPPAGNVSCDNQTSGPGVTVTEVTRENVNQFNNRFFCGFGFGATTSPPARPSGWEFYQNWTVSAPPGPVSVPNGMSGEPTAACAGSIDYSCRTGLAALERSPEAGRSCKSATSILSGALYATPDSGLTHPALIYQQELANLGAINNWVNGAPPVRTFQSSKRRGAAVTFGIGGCSNDPPFCQGVGAVQQCRALQSAYGLY